MEPKRYPLKLEKKLAIRFPLSSDQLDLLYNQNNPSLLGYCHKISSFFFCLQTRLYVFSKDSLINFSKTNAKPLNDLPKEALLPENALLQMDKNIKSIKFSKDDEFIALSSENSFEIHNVNNLIAKSSRSLAKYLSSSNPIFDFDFHPFLNLGMLVTEDDQILLYYHTEFENPVRKLAGKRACFSENVPELLYIIDSKNSLVLYNILENKEMAKIDLETIFSQFEDQDFFVSNIFEGKTAHSVVICGESIKKGEKKGPCVSRRYIAHIVKVNVNSKTIEKKWIFDNFFQLCEYDDSEYLQGYFAVMNLWKELDICVFGMTQNDLIQVIFFENDDYFLAKLEGSLRLPTHDSNFYDNKMRALILMRDKLQEEPEIFKFTDFDEQHQVKFPPSLMILSCDGFLYRYYFIPFKENFKNISLLYNYENPQNQINENFSQKIQEFDKVFSKKSKEAEKNIKKETKDALPTGNLFLSEKPKLEKSMTFGETSIPLLTNSNNEDKSKNNLFGNVQIKSIFENPKPLVFGETSMPPATKSPFQNPLVNEQKPLFGESSMFNQQSKPLLASANEQQKPLIFGNVLTKPLPEQGKPNEQPKNFLLEKPATGGNSGGNKEELKLFSSGNSAVNEQNKSFFGSSLVKEEQKAMFGVNSLSNNPLKKEDQKSVFGGNSSFLATEQQKTSIPSSNMNKPLFGGSSLFKEEQKPLFGENFTLSNPLVKNEPAKSFLSGGNTFSIEQQKPNPTLSKPLFGSNPDSNLLKPPEISKLQIGGFSGETQKARPVEETKSKIFDSKNSFNEKNQNKSAIDSKDEEEEIKYIFQKKGCLIMYDAYSKIKEDFTNFSNKLKKVDNKETFEDLSYSSSKLSLIKKEIPIFEEKVNFYQENYKACKPEEIPKNPPNYYNDLLCIMEEIINKFQQKSSFLSTINKFNQAHNEFPLILKDTATSLKHCEKKIVLLDQIYEKLREIPYKVPKFQPRTIRNITQASPKIQDVDISYKIPTFSEKSKNECCNFLKNVNKRQIFPSSKESSSSKDNQNMNLRQSSRELKENESESERKESEVSEKSFFNKQEQLSFSKKNAFENCLICLQELKEKLDKTWLSLQGKSDEKIASGKYCFKDFDLDDYEDDSLSETSTNLHGSKWRENILYFSNMTNQKVLMQNLANFTFHNLQVKTFNKAKSLSLRKTNEPTNDTKITKILIQKPEKLIENKQITQIKADITIPHSGKKSELFSNINIGEVNKTKSSPNMMERQEKPKDIGIFSKNENENLIILQKGIFEKNASSDLKLPNIKNESNLSANNLKSLDDSQKKETFSLKKSTSQMDNLSNLNSNNTQIEKKAENEKKEKIIENQPTFMVSGGLFAQSSSNKANITGGIFSSIDNKSGIIEIKNANSLENKDNKNPLFNSAGTGILFENKGSSISGSDNNNTNKNPLFSGNNAAVAEKSGSLLEKKDNKNDILGGNIGLEKKDNNNKNSIFSSIGGGGLQENKDNKNIMSGPSGGLLEIKDNKIQNANVPTGSGSQDNKSISSGGLFGVNDNKSANLGGLFLNNNNNNNQGNFGLGISANKPNEKNDKQKNQNLAGIFSNVSISNNNNQPANSLNLNSLQNAINNTTLKTDSENQQNMDKNNPNDLVAFSNKAANTQNNAPPNPSSIFTNNTNNNNQTAQILVANQQRNNFQNPQSNPSNLFSNAPALPANGKGFLAFNNNNINTNNVNPMNTIQLANQNNMGNNATGNFFQNNNNVQGQGQAIAFGTPMQRIPQPQFGQSSFGFNTQGFQNPAPSIKTQQGNHLFGQFGGGNNNNNKIENPSNNQSTMLSFSSLASNPSGGFMTGTGANFNLASNMSSQNQGFSNSYMQPRK